MSKSGIPARYSSYCCRCRGRIESGQLISQNVAGNWTHLDCVDPLTGFSAPDDPELERAVNDALEVETVNPAAKPRSPSPRRQRPPPKSGAGVFPGTAKDPTSTLVDLDLDEPEYQRDYSLLVELGVGRSEDDEGIDDLAGYGIGEGSKDLKPVFEALHSLWGTKPKGPFRKALQALDTELTALARRALADEKKST